MTCNINIVNRAFVERVRDQPKFNLQCGNDNTKQVGTMRAIMKVSLCLVTGVSINVPVRVIY